MHDVMHMISCMMSCTWWQFSDFNLTDQWFNFLTQQSFNNPEDYVNDGLKDAKVKPPHPDVERIRR